MNELPATHHHLDCSPPPKPSEQEPSGLTPKTNAATIAKPKSGRSSGGETDTMQVVADGLGAAVASLAQRDLTVVETADLVARVWNGSDLTGS